MMGYREDVLVSILECGENNQLDFRKVKINEVKPEDYVQVAYLPNRSLTYVQNCLSSHHYNGAVNFITLSDGQHLICCEDQKLLTCTYFHPACLPIIDEKTFDQLTEDNALVKIDGLSWIGMEQKESLDEYVERVEANMRESFRFKPIEIMDNREQLYEGILYNIDLPIEYGLIINDGLIVTTNHEHEGWI